MTLPDALRRQAQRVRIFGCPHCNGEKMGAIAMLESLDDVPVLELDPDSLVLSIAPWLEPLLGGDGSLTGTPLCPGWLAPDDWKQLLQTLEGAPAQLVLTRPDGVGITSLVRVTARRDGPGIALSLASSRGGDELPAWKRPPRAAWYWDLQMDAIIERDADGCIESWNAAAEILFGLPASIALGCNRFEILQTELPMPLPEIEAQLHQTGSWTGALTHRHPGGRVLRTTCQWMVRRTGPDGRFGVTEIHRDLGDPELAMREAQYFSDVHSALFDAETAGQLADRCLPLMARHYGWQAGELWLFDPPALPGASVDAAVTACTLTGSWLAPDAIRLKNQSPLTPQGAAVWTRADFPSEPRWWNVSFHPQNSSRPWRTILAVPLRSATHEMGALVFYSTANRPESPPMMMQLSQTGVQLGQWFHRHAAEDRLRRSEERFRALMESAPDALVITDNRGNITMANRQTEKLFGWTREQLIGKNIETLMPTRFRTQHVQHRDHFAEHPHARPMGVGMELAALRVDGSEFPVEISLSPIQIDNQTLVAAAIRDASERREMERTQRRLHDLEMAQAEHLATVGQLAAGMAHEIKNPLAGMSAALEVLASQNDMPPAATEIMGEVQYQATRIRKIVDELLNYARPRPAQLILADLNATLDQAIPFAAMQAQPRGVDVEFQPGDIPPILHDPEQIHRLVLNLLINAVDASSGGSKVELATTAASDGKTVTVTVTDHGSGIAQELLGRIFVPFFTTKGSRGTGLGLSLCRRIAEMHDGVLTVASSIGQGSRFTLTLPLKGAPSPEPNSGASFGQAKNPHR